MKNVKKLQIKTKIKFFLKITRKKIGKKVIITIDRSLVNYAPILDPRHLPITSGLQFGLYNDRTSAGHLKLQKKIVITNSCSRKLMFSEKATE